MKKAILFGSSGFVGSYLLEELLNDPGYEQVTVVVRKDQGIVHPRLKTLIGDFHSLPGLKDQISADEVFITLGTTRKKTPKQDAYYQADHDYPVLAAKIAKEKGAKSVFLLTAIGANKHSNVFYIRTKGETERDIIDLGFEHTHIFRPSLIMGNRKENRPLEKVFIKLWPAVDWIFTGKHLQKYKGIEGKNIARAMKNAAKSRLESVKIYHWKEMKELLSIHSRR